METATLPMGGFMKQRSFEIIRSPELEHSSFLFNNVEVTYVGTCPETGISFYCSLEHNYGVRVYPNGQKVLVNPSTSNTVNSKIPSDAKRKQRYLKFVNAFGHRKGIYVSHAVWMAAGRIIPPGMTIDHINGCTTDNRLENLRCIDNATNNRDGGFLRKLRNLGIDPVRIPRNYLLQYYSRMAVIKKTISNYRYYHLKSWDMFLIVNAGDSAVIQHFSDTYNIQISFTSCQMTLLNSAA